MIIITLVVVYLISKRLSEATTLGIKVDLGAIRELKQTRRYLSGWLIYWVASLVILAAVKSGHDIHSEAFTIHTTVTGLRGFVGFVIFVAMSKLTLSSQTKANLPRADLGEALLQECDDKEEEDSALTPRMTISLSDNWTLQFDDDSFHVTHLLRHDLIEMTAAGIAHCATQDWGGSFVQGGLPKELQDVRRQDCTSTTGGYRPHIKFPQNSRTIEHTLGQSARLDFFDYAPGKFYQIREALGVDREQYISAFEDLSGILFQYSVEAAKSKYKGAPNFHGKEVGSDGASGSFFYFTKNKRFIVKTISLHEKDNLVRIADSYLNHCTKNPGTLIHYYGCHSLRLPINSGKMYFCVMKNIFNTDDKISETYDLKGCTTNRRRLNKEQLDEFHDCIMQGIKPTNKVGTLLDWDWMDLRRQIRIADTELRTQLIQALHADSVFLAENQLLDYSLLVGVVRHDDRRERASCPRMERGASFAVGNVQEAQRCVNMKLELEDVDYYIGIGDILENWGIRWWVQGVVLKTALGVAMCNQWQNPDGITAVHHDTYAGRFYWFMVDRLLGVTDELSPAQCRINSIAVGPDMPNLRNGEWW